jgi:hypothetical protein
MEWTTVQHLDLRHVGRGLKPLQPHAASFHPHQALVAVAIGNFIIGKLKPEVKSLLILLLSSVEHLFTQLLVESAPQVHFLWNLIENYCLDFDLCFRYYS